jgi:ABC-2 type transport system permease protein
MTGAIFTETLHRSWRQILYWGLGMALLGAYLTAFIQDVDVLEQYARLTETLPPALLQLLGANNAAALATPEGFLSFGFFGYGLIIFAFYAVLAGLNVTANEEDEGMMDVLLSQPVPRWRVVLEKYVVYALIIIIVAILAFVGVWLGKQGSALELDMRRVFEGTINMIPGTLLMIALTMFIAAVAKRKSTAIAITTVVIIASYFIDFLGRAASGTVVASLRFLSFFNYYDSEGVMVNGLNPANLALLLGITVLLVVGTVWAFERRDIAV